MPTNRVSALDHLALINILRLLCFIATLIFVPVLSFRFTEGWIVWSILSAAFVGITFYFLRHGRALIERRLKVGPRAELLPSQKIIQSITTATICLTFVMAGLERRTHANAFEPLLGIASYILMIVALYFLFVVMRTNQHGAGTVTVESGQPVIDTGPYARIRHPMYAAAMLVLLALPVALGSKRAFKPAIVACAALILRIRDEERFLVVNLPGYREYCARVRSRLIPGVW